MGMNRSKYLANYLKDKGLDADCGGILVHETKNPVTQEKVDASSVIIFVQQRIKEKFLMQFTVGQQQIITLDVEDRIDIIAPQQENLSKEEIQLLYATLVYPKLEEQIESYSSLLKL